jgi:flagellin
MTKLNSNIPSVRVHYHGIRTQLQNEQALERLSSGKRINSAVDDAAGLFVAQRIKVKILGVEQAIRNSQDAIGLIQVAEAGLNEIKSMVSRINELAVQMANGVYSNDSDRKYAQLEVDQLVQQINLISSNTNFNGVSLLDGSLQNVNIQAGHTAQEKIAISLRDASSDGLEISDLSVTTRDNARNAMSKILVVQDKLSDQFAYMGAMQNRLTHNISLLSQDQTKAKFAFGRIMDADMAAESTNLSRTDILLKANAAMLAQSNGSIANLLILFE